MIDRLSMLAATVAMFLEGISKLVSRCEYKHEAQASELDLREFTRLRFVLVLVLKCALLIPAGCARDAPSSDADVASRVNELRALAATGDNESIDQLIDGLEDSSELARREAQRALSNVLKRKVYFDPSAPTDERARAVAGVRRMWRNLQERDLVEAVKERMPLQYYYDLNTGQWFEERAGRGPVETPSGPHEGMPAGVRAIVLACRDCGNEEDRYVGWLEVPVSALKEYGIPFEVGAEPRTFAIRRPDGGSWAVLGTAEAEAITDSAHRCSQGRVPLRCRPGR